MIIGTIKDFLRLESASGLLLVAAAILAMVIKNSPASFFYDDLLNIPITIQVGAFVIAKPLLLWINDGLMAVFFFLVGLEIKREVLDGELSNPQQIVLPAIAAVGGMAVPAGIYILFNMNDPVALRGWAIPAATDIAFALGVLSLLGDRVPPALKLFLLTLAIIDDLGAIIIIALFYTAGLSLTSLLVAAAAIIVLYVMNKRGVLSIASYLLIGFILWAAVLKSGVHATLAGVLLAFFIPLRTPDPAEPSPLRNLEHDLHPAVAFAILPIFAFANTGISLIGLTPADLLDPIPLGIAAGLLIGKLLGVFGCTWLSIKTGLAKLPDRCTWLDMFGVSVLCGIGFTMSLFISSLAFEQVTHDIADDRLGILVGSLLSALIGYTILRYSLARKRTH
ncbi:MAG: Na+/H+ antiporter NhaA [Gammaproteobacteria bacterium]|nr:Na+/H+ antiporter NhaA [Gammaproteobacteria bacterium]